MTYFLKKKKWMAWVVLLTFLFTSFMPTNLLAGNSVAEAANTTAYFFVRTDSTILKEPADESLVPSSKYYPQTSNGGTAFTLTGKINTNENVYELDKIPSKIVQYPEIQALVDQVATKIDKTFTVENYGETWDVTWYVIKKVDNTWHVDGAIQRLKQNQVIYDANGGKFQNGSTLEERYAEGKSVTVKNLANLTQPIREGYIFLGWATAPTATVPEYTTNKNTFIMPDYDVTLYAIWQEQNLDGVKLQKVDGNGQALNGASFAIGETTLRGSGSEFNLPTLTYGQTYTVTEIAPTGYTGVGSFTLAVGVDVSGNLTLTSNNDNVTYDGTTQKVTVKNTVQRYNLTVNHVYNGGPLDNDDRNGTASPTNFGASINESADGLTGTGYSIKSVTVVYTDTTAAQSLTISSDKTSVTGTMPASNVTITFTYEPIQVTPNAQIIKQDTNRKPLAGASFTFAGNTLEATSDATWYEKVAALFSSNEPVANIFPIVDSEGNQFTFVFGETYAVSETKAPAGYTGVAKFNVKLNADGTGLEFVGSAPTNVTVNGFTITVGNAENDDVTINYATSTGGTITNEGDETLAPATGDSHGSEATASAGYHFVKWTKNGADYSTNAAIDPQPVYADGDKYVAVFAENDDVTINYATSTGGTITNEGDETLAPATGDSHGSEATASAGYHFVKWTKNGADYSTNAAIDPQPVYADGDKYVAVFAENDDVTINYESTDIVKGTVSRESESLAPATGVAEGSIATATLGYRFENWTDEEGNVVGTEEAFIPEKVNGLNIAATYYANYVPIDYTVTYEYEGAVPSDVTSLPLQTTENHVNDQITVAEPATAKGFVFSGWTVKEPAGITIDNGTFIMPADHVVLVGSFSVGEGTAYTVNYHYQDPQTGEYTINGGFRSDVTTTGAIAFITQDDATTTRSMYQFNANMSDVQKMVKADGSTELNVYFDALYNVVYYYTDGGTPHKVARSGYVYHYGDSVVAPGMASVDQFDGRWYKNADGNTDEWVFDDETIEKNIGLVNADNTIYLYTTAKVTPLNDNTIKISKTAVNGTEGAEYGFNLRLLVKPTFETDPLTGEAADELQKYNSAMITARGQYDSAKGALEEAVSDFEGSMFMTTNSALTFVMYGPSMNDIDNNEIRPAVYGLTTGSSYEFQSYNLFEDSFDVVYADDVDNDVQKNIVKAIKRMAGLTEDDEMEVMSLRDAYQPFAPNALLYELVGLNTSGSALAFDFDAAQDLYVAAENLIGKRAAYQDARANLDDYMAEVGRYAVVTVTVDGESTKYVLNGTDEAGNKLFTPDESGKYILSFDFNLTSGAFKDFTVTATTGSTIQFIITETDDGGAVSTTVNGSTGHSVTGMMATGSALEYTFVNNFNSGDGGDPWTPTDPEDPRDPQDPIDIEDPDVPLAEPDVDEPDIEIEDPDVPLTDVPGDLVEIDEPEVPLGDAPRTGDSSNAIPFVVLMMVGITGLAITRRKFN